MWNYEKNVISKIGEYNIEKRNDLDYTKLTFLLKLKNNLLLVGGSYYFLNAFIFLVKIMKLILNTESFKIFSLF